MSLIYATAATRDETGGAASACLTRADVLTHLDRSRQGISLTCNEQILLRNLTAERESR